jgi:hypothetical protein
MAIVSHLHHLFNAETCQSSIHTLRWKDRPLQCPRCQSHNVGPWGTYHYQPGLHATAVKRRIASAPSMTSRARCWTAASALSCTGCSRRFCSASPAHLGVSPERWGCISERAIAAAGGCAMPRCPTRCTANWRVPLKRMTSITSRVRRDKRNRVGRKRWNAARVGAARSVSPVGGITIKIDPPLLRGSVARGRSSSTRR